MDFSLKLFISKKITHSTFLKFVNQKNIELIDQPMIDFTAVDFESPKQDYDIIFFTSPRSAKFYLERSDVPQNVNIGTIGLSTTQFVESKGHKVNFTGVNSGEPDIIAKEFKTFVKDKKVLFPQSNHSHQSMQKALSKDQIVNLIVYKTILCPIRLPIQPSVLVFTSPTNVRSFLKKNVIENKQRIIAWGKTTESQLKEKGVKVHFTLKYASFEELTEVLRKNFFS